MRRRVGRALLLLAIVAGAGFVLLTIVLLILIVMNSRDPYGGPIEPTAPHE